MVIEKILKQLTPKRIEKEIKAIQKVKLPSELQKWVEEYEKVGDRDEFLWRWSYKVAQVITFPGVPRQYHKSLRKAKFLMIMFIVLLDDIADKVRSKKLLNELTKIPFEGRHIKLSHLNRKQVKYLRLTKKVWRSLKKTVQRYPRHKEFGAMLNYDIEQLLNGMDYAYLVNKNPSLINEQESQIYLSYNTPATISYMIDLTCLRNFDKKNLGTVREIAWYAQMMTRIANWVSTWEREVREKDFTSGIFAYAIENNILTTKDLQRNDTKIADKIKKSKAEQYFLRQWEEFYNKIEILGKKNKSVNVTQILGAIEKLTILHLVSKKLI